MANNDEDGPTFKVTVEDCARWTKRLERMARALEQREQNETNADGVKMFYTASVLMQRLGLEIQQDTLFAGFVGPFGGPIGEA